PCWWGVYPPREPTQHAVDTAIAAAGPDRIDVGAEHDGRRILAATAHADDVADCVDGHGQAKVAHPSHQQVAPGAVFVAEREPAIAAARQGSDAIECIKPGEQPIAIDFG